MIVKRALVGMIVAVMACVFGIAIPALAGEAGGLQTTESAGASQWTIFGSFEYQSDTDVENGTDFSLTGGKMGLRIKKYFSNNLHLDTFSVFSVYSYDFSDTAALGGDPWGDVSNIVLMPVLNYAFADGWVILGGGLFNAAYEKNANEDNDNGGGLVGFKCIVNPNLTLGAALAIISETESDAMVIPVPYIDGRFAGNWYLKTGVSAFASDLGIGLETGNRLSEQMELSLATEIRYKRFRLDEDGVVPDGFGKDTNIPVYLKLTWRYRPDIAVEMSAGASVGGELSVEDINGKKVWREDYDPAAFAGLLVSCNF